MTDPAAAIDRTDGRVLLLGKPGCHLCDDARLVVDRVCAELNVGWAEGDVTQSAADLTEYGEMIPVVFVDGVVHGYWRIDEARLRDALLSP
jgi:hypothetical protein